MPARGRVGGLRDRFSSFRSRLRLFFVLVVVLPTIAVGIVIFALIDEAEKGQADARLAARQESAIQLMDGERAKAARIAERIGRLAELAAALRSADDRRVQAVARLALRTSGAERIVLEREGQVAADIGDRNATFPASRRLRDRGRDIGLLLVSATDPVRYARLVRRVTSMDVVIEREGRTLATTLRGADGATLPDTGAATVAGRRYRVATFRTGGVGGVEIRVTLLEPEARTADAISHGRLVAALIIAGFFLFAVIAAYVVSRALQGEMATVLAAARRIGSGDLSTRIRTRGSDEFAQLGQEFNNMAGQLQQRLDELARERARLQMSLRRIGETFASNLDRIGLLEIVVQTAVDAVEADGGQARLLPDEGPPELVRVAHLGEPEERTPAVTRVEGRVLTTGEPAAAEVDEAYALSHPLRAGPAAGEAADDLTGLITIWRGKRPFTDAERELFEYLARQAAVSVENAALHRAIERQAVTDELTGLANRRRFDEALSAEVERAKRFSHSFALILLDIDDFKSINDEYGHQQGDAVLREVTSVLRELSREIDLPARYGGEEFALILPGTDIEGAYNLAERIREAIAELRIPIARDEDGGTLRVTASFGVASLPGNATEVSGLFSAADDALYRAKRKGKNRTMRAV
jgi:diguanylate cyclase (GGDEF)-like protein